MNFVPSSASGFVPASHEDPKNPGVLKRVIATQQNFQAGQVQMLNWAQLPVGSSFQPHYHEDMQEVFVLLSGVVTMTVRKFNSDHSAKECITMRTGDTVMIDPTEIHQMQNIGDVVAEYIVFGISSQKGGKTIVVS
jgi:mannose-6-phosphate isomerase-like protein (cupin superfamily)